MDTKRTDEQKQADSEKQMKVVLSAMSGLNENRRKLARFSNLTLKVDLAEKPEWEVDISSLIGKLSKDVGDIDAAMGTLTALHHLTSIAVRAFELQDAKLLSLVKALRLIDTPEPGRVTFDGQFAFPEGKSESEEESHATFHDKLLECAICDKREACVRYKSVVIGAIEEREDELKCQESPNPDAPYATPHGDTSSETESSSAEAVDGEVKSQE